MKSVEQKCSDVTCDNVLKMTLSEGKEYTWTCQKCERKNKVKT